MNFFRHLSIRTKLILAALVPLLGLLYYLQLTLREEVQKRRSAQSALASVDRINEISRAIHEIQKERALTIAAASVLNTKLEDDLLNQWESTDRAVSRLRLMFQEERDSYKEVQLLDSIQVVRARFKREKSISGADVFYSDLKGWLLNEVGRLVRASDNLSLKNSFDEHLALLNTKEFLAQLRSELGRAVAAGRFDHARYGDFAMIRGKHQVHLQRFRRIASGELLTFFDRKFQGPFVSQTYSIIDSAFHNSATTNFGTDFTGWWNVSSSGINALKEVEDWSGELITKQAQADLQVASANVVRGTLIAVFIITIISLLLIFTIRGIINSITSIKEAADKVAKGETDVSLDVKIHDEIGDLAHSFNRIIDANRSFSEIANVIGQGDYSREVTIRGENDTLGISLQNMKANLSKLSNENHVRTWLLSGHSILNEKMRGEKEVKTLAQDIIIQVATYLKAQIGAIYLRRSDKLELTASYAFQHRKENSNIIKLGQGLVGQSALEKKPIIFSEVPHDYIRINSAIGNSVPKNILVFPLLYEDEVKGVIELGTASAFTDLDLEFLRLASDSIAIAFHASQSRSQMKELLEETQRQAEELEAQQEELRQSNEALEQKTLMLEKSEGQLKAQQEELQQTNEELEEKANLLQEQKERLGVAKMEIENKARELEATSKYKSEFLANMSHELRTPLNSILILSQLLSENKNNVLGTKEVEFVTNIYNAGSDLLNLINEILDLSKVESGKMELEDEEVLFRDVRNSMMSIFSEVARSKQINFRININEQAIGYPGIVTDHQRLEQILRNLLSNAFKFTEKNGIVELTLERLSPRNKNLKNRKLVESHEIIAFTVSDNGIGIPEHKQGIIFEAFQQADGSTKRKYGGTGLGLSISRELAAALGGEIHVSSEEGKGSTFTLYLPLRWNSSLKTSKAEAALPTPEVKPVALSNGQESDANEVADDRSSLNENAKTILIVEDDRAFATLLLDFVRSRNYKGIVAHQGNTGLNYARQFKPDAIILDMKLPVLDGTEVLKQLKADPELRHIPVQIISAYDLRKEGTTMGAFDFMKKPVSKESLQESFDKIEDFITRKLKRLLIVEDNVQQNKAICELIGEGDVKCSSAFSGTEAIQTLKNEKFDCIIVDLGLPDMEGFELLQAIKADLQLSKIPIVVYTGRDLSREESNLLNKLASTVVLKTVHSLDRLFDETTLFLHRVESRLPKEKQKILRKLHKSDEVLKGKTVLVVDDDMRNIYSLTNALEEEGLNCVVAENGKVAVQTVKENTAIDLVLMDIMMPEMDGFEATREIRKVNQFKKVPIIALTAKAMKGDREKCLEAGMSDYISKPVNMEQLLSLMRVWLYR